MKHEDLERHKEHFRLVMTSVTQATRRNDWAAVDRWWKFAEESLKAIREYREAGHE